MQVRDYNFLGNTQSLCPECLALVPAKIIARGKRVYFRKRCPEHGEREDFVCSDVDYYDRLEFLVPAKVPAHMGVDPQRGCPYDCGLCTEHEQHTCIALAEITANCNLTCPLCFAGSAPGGKHWSFEQAVEAIDALVRAEGRPEVLQLSGGEPTLHPEFERILDYAAAQPIDYVVINTNGIRFAHDARLVAHVAQYRRRLEIYFQLDGLTSEVSRALRGEDLLEVKLKALERLGEAGVHVTLAVTLQGGVNGDQLGPLVEFALPRRFITGISFQPATYSGRYVLPETLEQRITFPDVIKGIARQTNGLFCEADFMPLPCAHPNCHSLTYAYRSPRGEVAPLLRFIDARKHLDLLANGISFTRPQARNVLLNYLGKLGCCAGGCGDDANGAGGSVQEGIALFGETLGRLDFGGGEHVAAEAGATAPHIMAEFFQRALAEELGAEDIFRITITSFLDAYNFDLRRLMKCCTHHVLPSGHIIPFCAYNVLYREGHVPLPTLNRWTLAAGAT